MRLLSFLCRKPGFRFLLLFGLSGSSGLLAGCVAVGKLETLEAGDYQFFKTNDPALAAAVGKERAFYVEQAQDSLLFSSQSKENKASSTRQFSYSVRRGQHVVLLNSKFDLDVFTISFQGPAASRASTGAAQHQFQRRALLWSAAGFLPRQ